MKATLDFYICFKPLFKITKKRGDRALEASLMGQVGENAHNDLILSLGHNILKKMAYTGAGRQSQVLDNQGV